MDAFFAAVEEREKPWLKGKPIVVGADPKDGEGRGVVSTANYAARKYGIHSAMPISEAWRLAETANRRGEPETVFLTGTHKKYSEVSHKIMEYLRTLTPLVEQVSIDEAYLELEPITHDERLTTEMRIQKNPWKSAEKSAKGIKAEILKQEKLTCSIGIGPNKLIAKIASDHKKPDGLTIVRPEKIQHFLDPKGIRVIPGIGPKAEITLNGLGVKTIRDLRGISEEILIQRLGKWGADIYRKARGIDESPIVTDYETKSVGEQETFEHDTLDARFLLERLRILSREVFERLREKQFAFRTVSITVRFTDFETVSRAQTLKTPSQERKELEQSALALFLPFLDTRKNPRKKLIRLLGVRAEKLVPLSEIQLKQKTLI